jgi:hypothetical protein
VRDDPVVFRLSFSGHQSCQLIEQSSTLGLRARVERMTCQKRREVLYEENANG